MFRYRTETICWYCGKLRTFPQRQQPVPPINPVDGRYSPDVLVWSSRAFASAKCQKAMLRIWLLEPRAR